MPITTSMGGYYKDEMDWHRDTFPKSADPQMNIDADQFLNERMGTDEERAPLDLGLPPEDQTNPLNDVVSSNPQPTQVGLFSKFFGGSDEPTPVVSAPPLEHYPSEADAAEGLKYGLGYGTGNEPFVEGQRARVLGTTDKKGRFTPQSGEGEDLDRVVSAATDEARSRVLDLAKPENAKAREEMGLIFAQAQLAANRNPIAALGFDPSRTAMDLILKNATIGGLYSKDSDAIYANIDKKDPSSLFHESIHRGLQKLRDNPEAAKLIKDLGTEESVVRYMMYSMAGNPEQGTGALGDKQIEAGKYKFENPYTGKDSKAKLDKLLEIAANMRKDRRPGGPR